jgi:hypothetical protein
VNLRAKSLRPRPSLARFPHFVCPLGARYCAPPLYRNLVELQIAGDFSLYSFALSRLNSLTVQKASGLCADISSALSPPIADVSRPAQIGSGIVNKLLKNFSHPQRQLTMPPCSIFRSHGRRPDGLSTRIPSGGAKAAVFLSFLALRLREISACLPFGSHNTWRHRPPGS